MHHVAFDIGQAEVAAGVAEGQPPVVEAHEVQNGCVQVVHVHAILDSSHSELIGRAISEAAFDSAAGDDHEHGKDKTMLTIQTYGTGKCVWCRKNAEGVQAEFRDGFKGFLCRKDFWRALKVRAEATGTATADPPRAARQ